MGFSIFAKKKSSRSISRSSSDASTCSSSDASTHRSPRSVLRSRGPDGRIPRSELAAALYRLGPSADEVDAVLAEADRSGDGLVRIEDVCGAGEEEEQIRAAFAVYDLNGDGRISAEELREVMVRLGDAACSVEECRRMVAVVDSDGDGFVGFGDFARMMAAAVSWR